MRILFLSDNFPPEGNAPAARLWEHARHWVEAGHHVTVITCAPNFPEGKVYPGYRNRLRSVEMMSGIRVVRVKTLITANKGMTLRTLDYLSFMLMAVVMGSFEKRPDVVVATSPQFFCACGGWLLSLIKWRPFVFELRDLWPLFVTAVGAMRDSWVIRLMERLELFLYRRAALIVSVTEAFKTNLVGRGIDGDKIVVVRNGVNLCEYYPRPKHPELLESLGLANKFVVGYLGTHGLAHGLDRVIDAAERLHANSDIRFLFVGGGAVRDELQATVIEKGLSNVVMLERVPKESMVDYLSLCDVSLVPLRNLPAFSTVIPSKIFEAMAMGIPIVMTLPPGEATQIIEQVGAGVCLPPEDPVALASAIDQLSRNPDQLKAYSRNGLAGSKQFERSVSAHRMLQALQAVTGDTEQLEPAPATPQWRVERSTSRPLDAAPLRQTRD
jgi:colanic acid biosynthesis glycosyl transferase WcaI